MAEEILNIEYHQKRLMLAALNKFNNDEKAAAALGIGDRALRNWKKKFNIKKQRRIEFIMVEEKQTA